MTKTDDSAVFVDTSALIALLDPRDQWHARIRAYFDEPEQASRYVTSNLVLSEFLTFFSRRARLKAALDCHLELLKDPKLKIVWMNPALQQEAAVLLEKSADQKLSFTDAASFIIMKQGKITHALAFDADFSKAGFTTVP